MPSHGIDLVNIGAARQQSAGQRRLGREIATGGGGRPRRRGPAGWKDEHEVALAGGGDEGKRTLRRRNARGIGRGVARRDDGDLVGRFAAEGAAGAVGGDGKAADGRKRAEPGVMLLGHNGHRRRGLASADDDQAPRVGNGRQMHRQAGAGVCGGDGRLTERQRPVAGRHCQACRAHGVQDPHLPTRHCDLAAMASNVHGAQHRCDVGVDRRKRGHSCRRAFEHAALPPRQAEGSRVALRRCRSQL
jgi:hypothetical protein